MEQLGSCHNLIFQKRVFFLEQCVMPPLPSYPPSSSYQPLRSTADDFDDDDDARRGDIETASLGTSSSQIQQRAFLVSPYQSLANNPTGILKSFLSETRTRTGSENVPRRKQLALRITLQVDATSLAKSVQLPLPELTDQDSLPFALSDDVPCLRGLPAYGKFEWRRAGHSFLTLLRTPFRSRSVQEELQLRRYGDPVALLERQSTQVWNAVQKKPLYASSEEVERYRTRLEKGTSPPWAPLTETTIGTQQESQPASAATNHKPKKPKKRPADDSDSEDDGDDGEEYDPYSMMPSGGDFDLGSVFQRTRKRQASRLVSVGLQEAIERFSDDRHFSKWLVCREAVWGWDWHQLASQIGQLVQEGANKGKARESGTTASVSFQVVGLEPSPVYNVVWSPIPHLARVGVLASRPGLVAVSAFVPVWLLSVLLGVVSSGLVIFLGIAVSALWMSATYLVRTHTACVYDTIGTAWNLAPKWVPVDAPLDWDEQRVLASLQSGSASNAFVIDDEADAHDGATSSAPHPKLRKTDQGWLQLQGIDSQQWLHSHREQILASLT